MILIGISGKKQSGKDTVGKYIVDLFNVQYSRRINFADALKQEVAKATKCDLDYIEAHKKEFRPILQWWGTDFRRKLVAEDYWVLQWLQEVRRSKNQGYNLIICTDVRFANEAEEIKSQNGILIRIQGKVSSVDNHQSETDLDWFQGFDYTIRNYGTLDDLKKASEDVAKAIMEQHSPSPH